MNKYLIIALVGSNAIAIAIMLIAKWLLGLSWAETMLLIALAIAISDGAFFWSWRSERLKRRSGG